MDIITPAWLEYGALGVLSVVLILGFFVIRAMLIRSDKQAQFVEELAKTSIIGLQQILADNTKMMALFCDKLDSVAKTAEAVAKTAEAAANKADLAASKAESAGIITKEAVLKNTTLIEQRAQLIHDKIEQEGGKIIREVRGLRGPLGKQ